MAQVVVPHQVENQADSVLGARFQAVFPKRVRQVATRLTAGSRLTMIPISQDTVVVTTKSKDWLQETYGLFKGMWPGDATRLVRKLRDEAWE